MTGKHLQRSVFFNKALSVEPTRPTQVFSNEFFQPFSEELFYKTTAAVCFCRRMSKVIFHAKDSRQVLYLILYEFNQIN